MRNGAILGLFLLASCSRAPPPAEPVAPAVAAPTVADFSHDLVARGGDPAWSLTIRRTTLTLRRPGAVDVIATAPGAVIRSDQAAWSATTADGRMMTVMLYASPCSDGAGGPSHAYAADVRLSNESDLAGCADPAPVTHRR